jgi:hypothetical protein
MRNAEAIVDATPRDNEDSARDDHYYNPYAFGGDTEADTEADTEDEDADLEDTNGAS